MIEDIKRSLESYTGQWSEKNGVYEFKLTLAERKTFLSSKKLTYNAKIKIKDESKVVRFSEMLKESGFGLSSGSIDDGISSGVGFKTETYNTMNKGREGTIEESSKLFGQKYEYKFDYQEIRNKVESTVDNKGYTFEYQILPVK